MLLNFFLGFSAITAIFLFFEKSHLDYEEVFTEMEIDEIEAFKQLVFIGTLTHFKVSVILYNLSIWNKTTIPFICLLLILIGDIADPWLAGIILSINILNYVLMLYYYFNGRTIPWIESKFKRLLFRLFQYTPALYLGYVFLIDSGILPR